MKQIRLSLLARSDLIEIRRFIRLDKPEAADRQMAKFFRVFRRLAEQAEMGEPRPELGTGLRLFSVGTYTIAYRSFANGVEIARVVSGYRDIESLF
jgi:toxin ParE1/3/4